MTEEKNLPVVLIIMDGWGITEPSDGNAIFRARTPHIDRLENNYPFTTLQASGEAVGLPLGEVGNSEVGHLNLGAGKVVYQDLSRISASIADGSFFENEVFFKAFEHVKKNKSSLHLMGLLGPGGVHADDEHLYALLRMAESYNVKKVYLHLFLDGRDTPPTASPVYLEKLENVIEEYNTGQIATCCGRFFAMDRDQIWERIERTYRALVFGEGHKTSLPPEEAIKEAYKKKQTDEFVEPIVFTKNNKPMGTISDNDSVIFYNFRPDRTRQLTSVFIKQDFNFFKTKKFKDLFFVTMTEYDRELPSEVAFPPLPNLVENPLGRVLADNDMKQFHLAESTKWAHVTLFFNGMRDNPFTGEDRRLIPSLKIVNFAQKPEMSAYKIKESLKDRIESGRYAFIVVNFANPDMVGHTGDFKAAIKAIEVVDECVGEVVDLILKKNGTALITADHGNAEQMINPQTGKPDTEHTTNPVPFILVNSSDLYNLRGKNPKVPTGILGDVAPTVLSILGIPQVGEMTGFSLLTKN